jgi:hypothetical protein
MKGKIRLNPKNNILLFGESFNATICNDACDKEKSLTKTVLVYIYIFGQAPNLCIY